MSSRTTSTAAPVEKALVVAVDLHDPKRPLEPELAEFEALIVAAGAELAGRVVQRLDRVDPATLVGSGKAHEIAALAEELGATKIFVFNDLRPRQRINLEKIVPLPIVDRTATILDIFAQRARSTETRSWMRRRSTSNFVSPGPRVPTPPPSRESAVLDPIKLDWR